MRDNEGKDAGSRQGKRGLPKLFRPLHVTRGRGLVTHVSQAPFEWGE